MTGLQRKHTLLVSEARSGSYLINQLLFVRAGVRAHPTAMPGMIARLPRSGLYA